MGVWGFASKFIFDKIVRIQNQALTIITGAIRSTQIYDGDSNWFEESKGQMLDQDPFSSCKEC